MTAIDCKRSKFIRSGEEKNGILKRIHLVMIAFFSHYILTHQNAFGILYKHNKKHDKILNKKKLFNNKTFELHLRNLKLCK